MENAIEQGEKVLLFSCFSRPLEKFLKHFGESAVGVRGEMSLRQRQESVDRFQNDESVRLMAAQIVAGGVGINLTAAVNVTYMIGMGTVDEFVRAVLEEKANLIDQLVEGSALPADLQVDVMGELRRVMGVLEPRLATLSAGDLDEAKMQELLEEAGRTFRASQEPVQTVTVAPPPAAVEALARVLAGRPSEQYRVDSSTKPGTYYELEVDEGDVICNCKGFGYRGSCQHARALKEFLVRGGGELPPGFSKVGS